MSKFTVLRSVDAFVTYKAEVEASSAIEAAKLAQQNEDQYKWEEDSAQEFDARSFSTLDDNGVPIEETQTELR